MEQPSRAELSQFHLTLTSTSPLYLIFEIQKCYFYVALGGLFGICPVSVYFACRMHLHLERKQINLISLVSFRSNDLPFFYRIFETQGYFFAARDGSYGFCRQEAFLKLESKWIHRPTIKQNEFLFMMAQQRKRGFHPSNSCYHFIIVFLYCCLLSHR